MISSAIGSAPGSIAGSASTPEYAARAIRRDILAGRLRENQPLRQDRLAERLGVSKVPVREALIQLKAEGLVTFLPNRGAVVSILSPREADEIFTMRAALETTALRRALPALAKADLIRAQGTLEIMDQEADPAQWSELNWEFHATLYQAARMDRLLETIGQLNANVGRYLVIYLDDLGRQQLSQEQHWSILKACREGNADRAVGVLTRHLEQASARLVAFLENRRSTLRAEGEE